MLTNVYHWYHGKLNVGHQTCRHPRPWVSLESIEHVTSNLKKKMAGQSQKVWILEDFALNQSICAL